MLIPSRNGSPPAIDAIVRKFNLAVHEFVKNGIFAFAIAEDGSDVPESLANLEVHRIGGSMGRALAALLHGIDDRRFFRLRLKLLSRRRFADRVWYWSFMALDREWLAVIELVSERACMCRIWVRAGDL